MKIEKNKLLILILIFVIIVLLGIIVLVLIVKPAINGYIIKGQNEGVQYAIYTIMENAKQCQQVPLMFKNETMNMIWVDCLKQTSQVNPLE